RLRDIGDVRIQLEDALAASEEAAAREQPRWQTRAALGVAGLALAALATVVWSTRGRDAGIASPDPVRFSVQAAGSLLDFSLGIERIALSADGSKLAVAMADRL